MSTATTRQLLTQLVAAFGDPARTVELLAPDVQWWISPTVGVLGSPTVGREAVADSMHIIFGQMYADVHTVVHHVLAQDDTAAVRFTMHATALFADGKPYHNEYCVGIEVADGEITRVWEYLDVAYAAGQYES